MESRFKLLGHPPHQMLVAFPLGLLATSVIFDIIFLVADNARWSEISYWMIVAGLIGGVIAAPFGLIDWLTIPMGTRAKRIGLYHGLGNLFMLTAFFLSWFLRAPDVLYKPSNIALGLSFFGVMLGMFTGWLGGELVDRLAVGVDEGANLDAPSSLSGQPAHVKVSRTSDIK